MRLGLLDRRYGNLDRNILAAFGQEHVDVTEWSLLTSVAPYELSGSRSLQLLYGSRVTFRRRN